MAKVSRMVAMTGKAAATDFIGLDLSGKTGRYVVLSTDGRVVQDGKLKLTQAGGGCGAHRRKRLVSAGGKP